MVNDGQVLASEMEDDGNEDDEEEGSPCLGDELFNFHIILIEPVLMVSELVPEDVIADKGRGIIACNCRHLVVGEHQANGHESVVDLHRMFREAYDELVLNCKSNTVNSGLINSLPFPEEGFNYLLPPSVYLHLQAIIFCLLCFMDHALPGTSPFDLSVMGDPARSYAADRLALGFL
eukprot:g34677.t1